jgi:hypothetical protein
MRLLNQLRMRVRMLLFRRMADTRLCYHCSLRLRAFSVCCPTLWLSGIRIALGAQREQVLRGMLADGLRPALIGLVLGLVASAATTQFIKSMLYETQPLDPGVFAGVAALLMASATLACMVPAWRASRLDPMRVLRME